MQQNKSSAQFPPASARCQNTIAYLVAGRWPAAKAGDLLVALDLPRIRYTHNLADDLVAQVAKGCEMWAPQHDTGGCAAAHVRNWKVEDAVSEEGGGG